MDQLILNPRSFFKIYNISGLEKDINIPEIQRLVNESRVEQIYENIKSCFLQGKEINCTGVFTIAELNNVKYLLDGQHRFKAYLKLYNEKKDYDTKFIVNIIKVKTEEEMNNLFEQVNDTVPVAEIPKGLTRKDSNKVIDHFMKKYPKIFSEPKIGSVKRPHIHQSKFEKKIFELLECYSDTTLLISKLEELNEKLTDYNILQFRTTSADNVRNLDSLRQKAIEKGGLFLECSKI